MIRQIKNFLKLESSGGILLFVAAILAIICANTGVQSVYFDFLHTNFIDSSGIGLVLGRYNQLKLDDRQLYLANLSKTSYKVFELSGMFDLMEYVEEVKG